MNDTAIAAEPEYWIAVRLAPTLPLQVFGPFTLDRAKTRRVELSSEYSKRVLVTPIIEAETRDQAEHAAISYLTEC